MARPTIQPYRFGWHPHDEPGAPVVGDIGADSFEAALTGLQEAIGDFYTTSTESVEDVGLYRRLDYAWSAFAHYIEALSRLGEPFRAIGPDGNLYWVAKTD